MIGLLFLLYSCVSMIFWRVFMRISYSCPAHLKFGMTVEKWSALVKLTGDSIDWLDKHDKLYDVWLLVAYAATSCALVQVSSRFPFLICSIPCSPSLLAYGRSFRGANLLFYFRRSCSFRFVFRIRLMVATVSYVGKEARPGGSSQAEETARLY